MEAGEFYRDLALSMMGGSQQLADVISNETRNGCFEHCDGWPEPVATTQSDILYDAMQVAKGEIDQQEVDALIERAKKLAEIIGAVEQVCKVECPGAYSLFRDDSELYDGDENPVMRTCPVKEKLLETAVQLSAGSTTLR